MKKIISWIWGETRDKEIKEFFEKTTAVCFNECISNVTSKLNEKEKKCLSLCTTRRIEMLKEIEEHLMAQLQK
ncbi:mitochondrial import inner membrane translocase subunit TIM13 [Nematocida sp. LUAm3]|nr:mitochondrial import inner membrane translocase subunit TIM13 [Nematocida sp. LUAm3]KAI5176492.1 mitochondrial import inner membrane translocase subunit TIM13 [Nematocida sp. LUAm2]KAI5179130.1 mitochondrial import inner membrane translocase subunit TIM13 [Nematocida sp. LUAm1]